MPLSIWKRGHNPGWADLARIRKELDDLMTYREKPYGRPLWGESQLFPLLNVIETTDSFVVTTEIPGMKTEDLEIKIEGDTLSLRGKRHREELDEGVSYHRRERAIGSFQRSLTFPRKIDGEKVNAAYKNGVLTVTLVKEKPVEAKQITVKAS
jgi:HSP20 family protein